MVRWYPTVSAAPVNLHAWPNTQLESRRPDLILEHLALALKWSICKHTFVLHFSRHGSMRPEIISGYSYRSWWWLAGIFDSSQWGCSRERGGLTKTHSHTWKHCRPPIPESEAETRACLKSHTLKMSSTKSNILIKWGLAQARSSPSLKDTHSDTDND